MVGKKNLPEELYDIKLLFPHFFNPNQEKTATNKWLVKSAFTTSAVGLLSSFWLNCKLLCCFKKNPLPCPISKQIATYLFKIVEKEASSVKVLQKNKTFY